MIKPKIGIIFLYDSISEMTPKCSIITFNLLQVTNLIKLFEVIVVLVRTWGGGETVREVTINDDNEAIGSH